MRLFQRLVLSLFLSGAIATAQSSELSKDLHFLIPAGPGGGWDGTARAVGMALEQEGLVERVTFENLSGGGGGRALAKFIENPERYRSGLLVSSTPILVRALQGVFPQTFRDLSPIASVISDYSCFAVHPSSSINTFEDLINAFNDDPRGFLTGGGSVRGDTDHFILARAMQLAGVDPLKVRYLAYDGGGQAAASLAAKEITVLSTGLSEAIGQHRAGLLRIIAITAEDRIQSMPEIPTLMEQGVELTFANWRGFFATKETSAIDQETLINTLRAGVATQTFEDIRVRNGWEPHFIAGDEFKTFLEEQEQQILDLMQTVGYLKRNSR